MSFLRRWEIPILFVVIPGLITAANYFLNIPEIGLKDISGFFVTTATVVGACAVLYGVTGGLFHQFRRARTLKGTWYLNVLAIFLFAVMLVSGLNYPFAKHSTYAWLFNNVVVPLGTALYALRAFYIFSGAFRAFIARTLEATLLLITGTIVVIGNTPMAASFWGGFSAMGEWLNKYPSVGGMRGFTIGVGIGATVLAIRTLVGRERAQLGME